MVPVIVLGRLAVTATTRFAVLVSHLLRNDIVRWVRIADRSTRSSQFYTL
jgi:hypothetical protein